MAGLPQFLISTQTDPYWEIPFLDSERKPLSVAGRVFEAVIARSELNQGVAQPPETLKVLTFGDGLSVVAPTDGSGDGTIKNTFVHQVSRAFAQANFPRGELTADILEVVDGTRRRLLIPVRLRYDDPAAIRDFVADAAGVVFGAGRQPVVTPVAIAGQVGRRGAGFLTGSGAPTALDGEDDDYWIDNRADPPVLYGPKARGTWPANGQTITSKLTPELRAARDAALAAAAGAKAGAQAVAADRQAVNAGAIQVEGARQIVVTAQLQISQDATRLAAAREATLLARNEAVSAQAAADAQRVAAQAAAGDVRQYAALVGAAALDFNFDSDPSPLNDWNA
jgi:hypothetical protein